MSVKLFSRALGPSGAPVIFVAHGLCGSGRNWLSAAEAIAAAGFQVQLLDARDHGQSPWTDELSYPAMAEDFLAHWQAQGAPEFIFLGHSMGGKLGMALAADPRYAQVLCGRLRGLCVVDILPSLRHPPYLAALQACRDLPLQGLQNRKEAAKLLGEKIPDENFRQWLLTNLTTDTDGSLRWTCNFSLITRSLPSVAAAVLSAGQQWRGPTLFAAGDRSDYIPPGSLDLIQAHFPAARLSWFPAGHNVHVEALTPFMTEFLGFVRAISFNS